MWRLSVLSVDVARVLERVERRTHRAVADRVHVDLPPGRVERRDRGLRDPGREVGRAPALAGDELGIALGALVDPVRLQQSRGLGRVLDHAVEEQLHGSDRHIGPTVGRAHLLHVREQRGRVGGELGVAVDGDRRPHRKRSLVAEQGHRGQLLLAPGCLQVRGDALLGHLCVGGREGTRVLFGCERRDLVGDEADRVVEQDPGRLAVRPAADLAPGRVRCARVDAADRERPRVGECDVSVEREDDDRPRRLELVEILLGRQLVHRGRVPEVDRKPAVGLLFARAGEELADRRDELLQVELAVVEGRRGQHETAGQRVHVPVVDPGHHHPPTEVDHLGAGAGERVGAGVGADVGDPAVGDRHRLLARAREGVDAAVAQYQICCCPAARRRQPRRAQRQSCRRGGASPDEGAARQRPFGCPVRRPHFNAPFVAPNGAPTLSIL